MIRLTDAIVLAHTKLRVHKIRTWVAVSVSGILFGLLIAVVFVVQGAFNSVESFSKEGLTDRYLVQTSISAGRSYDYEAELKKAEAVAEVEKIYNEGIEKRKAEAKRLKVDYDPRYSDPSPITIDDKTKKKSIENKDLEHWAVDSYLNLLDEKYKKPSQKEIRTKGFNVINFFEAEDMLSPINGSVAYMKDGKEKLSELTESDKRLQQNGFSKFIDPTDSLAVAEQDLIEPFIVNKDFDTTTGHIPVIIPQDQAEELLNMKELGKDSSYQDKINRLKEVRSRLDEIEVSFCYRNLESQMLVSEAIRVKKDIEKNKDNKDYVAPALIYKVPSYESCGAVEIESDKRTKQEKEYAASMEEFSKLFENVSEPVQHKINVKVVGIARSYTMADSMSGVGGLMTTFLSSYMMSTNWTVPNKMLDEIPKEYKPDVIFAKKDGSNSGVHGYEGFEQYIVEFSNYEEAKDYMNKTQCFDDCGEEAGFVSSYPYGSSSIAIAEAKGFFAQAMFWAVLVVSGVAMFILAGTVGRTIAEGRRETAIFRAIGAKRSDISSIYTVYTLFLSLRILIVAIVLALTAALAVQIWIGQDATVSAQLAFGVNDYDKQFLLVGFDSIYSVAIAGFIIVASLLSMIIPLLRNVRRNPINDMRDDT